MFEPDQVRRIAAFRRALRRFERTSERAARGAGVTPRQYLVLLAVAGRPEGRPAATIGDLAAELQLARNTVTGLVDRAEAAGLVRRHGPSAGDGRVVHVSLTGAGERALADVMRRLDADRAAVAEAVAALQANVPPT
jgi:DNA-binding MarR family transcriptional regulator